MTSAGTFPKPINLTPTRIAWRETDVLAWLRGREESGATAAVDDDRR